MKPCYSPFHKHQSSIFLSFILNVLFNQHNKFSTFLLILLFNLIIMNMLISHLSLLSDAFIQSGL